MLSRILRLLASGRVHVLQENIVEWGLCEYETRSLVIRASLSRRNKAKTLIHECVHYLHPEFSEDTVLCIERDIWKQINLGDYRQLLFYLGEKP